jgi:hypothetical protein
MLEGHKERTGGLLPILARYFEITGDLVPDPDTQIRVYPATKMAEALIYQDQFGYREVYPEPGKVNVAAKKDLNHFLSQWLKNCLEQGYSFRKAGESDRASGVAPSPGFPSRPLLYKSDFDW